MVTPRATATSSNVAQKPAMKPQTCLMCWRTVMAAQPIDLCPSCAIRHQRRRDREVCTDHDLLIGEAIWAERNFYLLSDLKALWRMFYRLTSDPTSPGHHNAALLYARRIVAELMLPYHDFIDPPCPLIGQWYEAPLLVLAGRLR